jgi:type II secretory pathway pseudopilin PulG
MNAQQQIKAARQTATALRAAISSMKVGSKKWLAANDDLDALVSKISFLDAMIRNGHM